MLSQILHALHDDTTGSSPGWLGCWRHVCMRPERPISATLFEDAFVRDWKRNDCLPIILASRPAARVIVTPAPVDMIAQLCRSVSRVLPNDVQTIRPLTAVTPPE